MLYWSLQLPERWIALGSDDVWYVWPAGPDGWRQRTPYRGYLDALQPARPAAMAKVVTYEVCATGEPVQLAEAVYSVSETAEALGLTVQTVRQQIAAGALDAAIIGTQYAVTASEIERYRREQRGRPGRTRTPQTA